MHILMGVAVAHRFQQINRAYELLSDPKKRTEYDKKLKAESQRLKRQRERDAALDAKRKKMKDELFQKEQSHATAQSQATQWKKTRAQAELSKVQEDGRKAMEAFLSSKSQKQQQRTTADPPQQHYTIRVKWSRKSTSHSEDTLVDRFKQYGTVVLVKIKGSSSAKIIMDDLSNAIAAVKQESGKWKEIELVGQIIPTMAEARQVLQSPIVENTMDNHLQYEKQVLDQLLVAGSAAGS